MSRETHLVEVLRASDLDVLQVGTRFDAPPPVRGRYHLTESISVPVQDVRIIAIEHKEEK